MNITLRINRANMDAYSDPADLRPGWVLTHLGNGDVPDEAVAAAEPEVLIVDAVTPVPAALMDKLPKLKLIHSQGVAYDKIDCAAAKERGVWVCNNAGVNAAAVAEHAVLLMLAALRRLVPSQEAVFAGEQIVFKNSCFSDALPELLGKKVGILGYGAIGRELAKRLAAFGCEIFYNDVVRARDETGVRFLEREALLKTCDIVTLHVPVLPATRGMMNAETLALLKPGAMLVNTARGALVDDLAVRAALESGALGAYAADTLDPEPVTADNPLLSLSPAARARVLFTPHVAGLTVGSFRRTYQNVWRNVAAVEDGKRPGFVVNGL